MHILVNRRESPPLARCAHSLAISGSVVAPTIALVGGRAGAAGWARDRGSALWTRRGSGTALGYQQKVSSRLVGVKFAGTGAAGDGIDNYHAAWHLDAGDVAWRLILKRPAAPAVVGFLLRATNAAGTQGIDIRLGAATTSYVYLAPSTSVGFSSVGQVEGTVYDVWGFIDRGENSTNGGICYSNNVAGVGVNFSTVAGDLTIDQDACIGSLLNGTYGCNAAVAGFWLWQKADWFPGGSANPTAWAACVSREYAKSRALLS